MKKKLVFGLPCMVTLEFFSVEFDFILFVVCDPLKVEKVEILSVACKQQQIKYFE